MSLLTSINVNLRYFPEIIVTGPLMSVMACFVKFRIKHRNKVDLPTFGILVLISQSFSCTFYEIFSYSIALKCDNYNKRALGGIFCNNLWTM